MAKIVLLHDIAHARTGDKGNRMSIGLFAYEPEFWSTIVDQVTEERVLELFRHRGATAVRRYVLPKLHALNFVIENALEGGVNGSLNLDAHGKSNSFRLLGLSVTLPEAATPAQHSVR
jgi:hypothetical protein